MSDPERDDDGTGETPAGDDAGAGVAPARAEASPVGAGFIPARAEAEAEAKAEAEADKEAEAKAEAEADKEAEAEADKEAEAEGEGARDEPPRDMEAESAAAPWGEPEQLSCEGEGARDEPPRDKEPFNPFARPTPMPTPPGDDDDAAPEQAAPASATPVTPEVPIASLAEVELGPLAGVNLTLIDHAVTALLGPANAGKSSLLRALLGLERGRGTITVGGLSVPKQARKVRETVAYVGPDPTFYPSQDATSLGRFLAGLYRRWAAPAYLAHLEALGIPRDRKLNDLPLAQRQLVSLAGAFAAQPALVLVDVPPALGDWGRDLLLDGIAQLRRLEAVVIADSRVHGLEALATRVAVLAHGHVRYTGPIESLLGQLRAYSLADPKAEVALPPGLVALHRSREVLYARGAPPDPLPPGLLSVRPVELSEAYCALVGEVVPGPRPRGRARSS